MPYHACVGRSTFWKVVHPTLVNVGKDHFGCDGLAGVELDSNNLGDMCT